MEDSNDSEQNEIVDLLDYVVEKAITRERSTILKHKSTATLYRCDDPSAIAVAHSYQEMNRIVEEYRHRPENEFFMVIKKTAKSRYYYYWK